MTLHRPSNVDDPKTLAELLRLLRELARELPLLFPVHPRTRKAAERFGVQDFLEPAKGSFLPCESLPHVANLALMAGATVVLTDSRGMQESRCWVSPA